MTMAGKWGTRMSPHLLAIGFNIMAATFLAFFTCFVIWSCSKHSKGSICIPRSFSHIEHKKCHNLTWDGLVASPIFGGTIFISYLIGISDGVNGVHVMHDVTQRDIWWEKKLYRNQANVVGNCVTNRRGNLGHVSDHAVLWRVRWGLGASGQIVWLLVVSCTSSVLLVLVSSSLPIVQQIKFHVGSISPFQSKF